jgi:lysophospholipase L1-like esterase
MWLLKGIVISAAIFGITTADLTNPKWAALQILVFVLPIAVIWVRTESLRILGVWASILFLVQSLASPLVANPYFKTLPPNLKMNINVTGGIPGITGKQTITTDNKGFRTTKEIDYSSQHGYRIFAIGGSTTEQIYLDDKRTWTHLLQGSFEKTSGANVEVVNTGVSGLRAQHHLATLRSVADMKPNLILFLIGINDWNHHVLMHFSRLHSETFLAAALEFRNELVKKVSLKNTLLGNIGSRLALAFREQTPDVLPESRMGPPMSGSARDREVDGSYFTRQRGSLDRAKMMSFKPEAVSAEYAQDLESIGAFCRQKRIDCMFITQPTGYQASATELYKKGFWMTPPNANYTLDFDSMVYLADLYNRHLRAFAMRHGHYFCDAASKFEPSYENFSDDCHFNERGAKRMSEVIRQCIDSAGLL